MINLPPIKISPVGRGQNGPGPMEQVSRSNQPRAILLQPITEPVA